MKTKMAVLVSGNGSNLQALIDAIQGGSLNAEISVVISNKPNVFALERATKAGIPSDIFRLKNYPNREAYDKALAEKILPYRVDLIVLAGFMHILSSHFLEHFPNRVLNVHPALLPADPSANEIVFEDGTRSPVFRGIDAVKQALATKVKWTGGSVHLVTPDVDRGPVLESRSVPILENDTIETLHARIQREEHQILPLAITKWASHSLA